MVKLKAVIKRMTIINYNNMIDVLIFKVIFGVATNQLMHRYLYKISECQDQ